MVLIDFHTHFFSGVYFRTLAAQSPRPGDAERKAAELARAGGFELPTDDAREHAARWTAEMRRHGVDHLCTFASVPEEVPAVVAAAAASDGLLSAFALVNPRVSGAVERLDGLLADKRVRGALVFPALHQWRWSSDEARALLGVLDRHGAILFAHCGHLVVKARDLLGFPRTQDASYANPIDLIPAAGAHPKVKFVIPHFGAGYLRETLMAGAQCPNVFVDTSSSNAWRAFLCPKPTLSQVFERALEVLGPERILFGTDSNVFPPGWRVDRWEEQRRALVEIGASEHALELVFGGNARRLLGLG